MSHKLLVVDTASASASASAISQAPLASASRLAAAPQPQASGGQLRGIQAAQLSAILRRAILRQFCPECFSMSANICHFDSVKREDAEAAEYLLSTYCTER
jgi:hypothetical protein